MRRLLVGQQYAQRGQGGINGGAHGGCLGRISRSGDPGAEQLHGGAGIEISPLQQEVARQRQG